MDAHSRSHPTPQTLGAYGLGKLDERSAEAVRKHLEQCGACRQRVAELSADTFLGRIREAQKAASDAIPELTQPDLTRTYTGADGPAPTPANALPPGLADHPDYEIKRELGRGGMGVVYLAHNKWMGRDEVLKVMGRHVMERPGVLERFQREIRAVARLRHPNIVTAYHATRLDESIIFAMEYVPGLDLSRTLKAAGPVPVANACYFTYQTALGLQHAHDEGLVHRDIKPGNLMLTHRKDKAMIKILDFGLAKLTQEEKYDTQLTSEGQALGTPDYIAPEQIIDAMAADIRSDIYSLGSTLYHLLAGRPPFRAKSTHEVYQAHISQDADLLNVVRPDVSAELAEVVAKMMAKDPDRRFQSPKDVAQAFKLMSKTAGVSFARVGTEQSRAPAPAVPTQPAKAGTEQSRVEPPAVPTQPVAEPGPANRPARNKRRPARPLSQPSPKCGQQAKVAIKKPAVPRTTIGRKIDKSASKLWDWSRRPSGIVAQIEPGGRVIVAIFGAILLRLVVVISSALTFGSRGATLDEARMSSMGIVFSVLGIVLAGYLSGRQPKRRDRVALGFTGGLIGVLIAAVIYAVIRSIEPVLGPLSSSVVAILMLWIALGAAIGLVLAVVIRPRYHDSPEVVR